MTDDFEARLRDALTKAEEADQRATEALDQLDAHPNSQTYKTAKTHMLLMAGQVMGLQQALNLLTGEEIEPNVAMMRRSTS
jgi:hypothetical protein